MARYEHGVVKSKFEGLAFHPCQPPHRFLLAGDERMGGKTVKFEVALTWSTYFTHPLVPSY